MLKASQKPPGDKLAPEAKKKGLKAGPNSIKSSPIPLPLVDAEKAIKLKGKKAGMSGQEGDGADLNMRGGKQAGSLLQALAQAPVGKNVASRVRRTTTSSDGAGVASMDRLVSAEGISGNPAGSGGERVGPSILAGLKAGKLSQPPSKQISAPKTGPWRKIAMPTPLHVDWKAPLEYALNSSGTSSSGWSGFDDAEKPIAVIVPEDQLDPTTDLVGVDVYNDGLAPDSDEIELESKYKEQILKAKKESKTRKWSTPTLSFESRFECGNLRKAIRKGETEYTLFMRDDVCSMDQGKEVRNSKRSIPHNKVYCPTRPYLSATPWFSLVKNVAGATLCAMVLFPSSPRSGEHTVHNKYSQLCQAREFVSRGYEATALFAH
jgi:hypothetical protein